MKNAIVIPALLLFILSFLFPSCVMVKTDNGNHKGWYKNPQNPHNPQTTKTNGGGNGKSKK